MKQVSTTHAALAGLSASLVGIGLARFAYTPLIPALIAAHWFAPAAVVYLGAANLAGYLAGALAARPLAAWKPAPGVLRGMMLLATAASSPPSRRCRWHGSAPGALPRGSPAG